MKLSIIIPVYNVEKYVDACLASVLSQKGDFEVIAVDDGSTDKSSRICLEWTKKDPRLRLIRQENRGLGGARNTGIEAAKGEWLMFVDSDDELKEGALELLERSLGGDPDAVIFRFAYEDAAGRSVEKADDWRGAFEAESFSSRKDLLLENPNACDKLIKSSLFASSGVRFPEKVLYEDLRTIPKLLSLCGKVSCIDRKLYIYKERAGSIMNGRDAQKNEQIIAALDDLLFWFEERGTAEPLKNELEMLAVRHVLIAATVRVLRADPGSRLPERFVSYMESRFPDYKNNKYIKELSRSKRLAFRLAAGKHFRTLGALFGLKDLLGARK